MRLIEYAPLGGVQGQRVREGLKHPIAAFRSMTMSAKRGERQSVRGVVSEIEAAFQGQGRIFHIRQPYAARTKQTAELRLRRRFSLELADTNEIIQRRGAHPHGLSAIWYRPPAPL